MRRTIAIAILAAALVAGCAPTTPSQAQPTTTITSKTSSAAPASEPRTTVSERLAHWQEVVRSMTCPELAQLEQRSLVLQANDQSEALIAVHDREAELHC